MNNPMKKHSYRLTIVAAALLSTGCVSPQLTTQTRNNIDTSRTIVAQNFEKAMPPSVSKHAYEKSQEVDAPWIVGKSVPLARSVTMPPALQKDVQTSMMFKDSWVSLTAAAERIMLATNMVVTIAPDVYLDSAALQRKALKGSGASGVVGVADASVQPAFAAMPVGMPAAPTPIPLPLPGAYGNAPPPVPVASGAVGKEQRGAESANGFDMPRMNAPLSQILDIIATKLSIKWKYEEASNSIRFYRLVTKTWETPFRASKSSYRSTLEGETSQSSNTNALSNKSQDKSPVEDLMSDMVELTAMRDNVDSVMTHSGSIFANIATGTITLTDTTEVVEAADSIISNGVRSLSRMVRLRLQTIKVTSKDSGEAGIDISAAVSRALRNVPDFAVSLGSAANLASTNAGSLGLQVFSGSASGSSAMLKALAEIGDVETSTEIPIATRNRRSVYYNVRNTFSYVASTTPAAATTGGTGGTPGITTAQDSVGLKLFMLPEVTAKDTVMLNMSLDQSTLKSLETFSSGTGANLQSVQLPNIDGEGSSQYVPIRNGQTVVLTGFDTKSNQYDKRTLGNRIPLLAGGSLRASETRSTTIVLVTAEVVDGITD
jgi:type IVB pilus formation R64 PilN family outer membrane protein